MQWNAIVAAVRGDVDASDVAALIAASRPLYTLTQQVADRRLDIELAHPDEAGRVIDYIGPLAAPLWIADNAVAVAQSLCDAEAQAHPQAPARMSRDAHAHALALLALVEPVMTEVSTALANPSYAMKLRMPMALGLQGAVGALGYVPLDPVYLRGLMQGAERLQGAANQAVQECKGAMQSKGAPPWLPRVLPYLDGQMAAAEVRLESVRARGAPVLAHQKLSDQALREVITDCWTVIDTYAAAGQLATYPRLLPGAPRLEPAPPPKQTPPARSVPVPPRPTPAPAQSSAPARLPEQPAPYSPPAPPPPEPPRRLPEIAPTGAPTAHHTGGMAPGAPTPARSLPAIAPDSQSPARAAPPETAPRTLPSIGAAPRAAEPPPSGAARALPQIGPAAPPPASHTSPSATPCDPMPRDPMPRAPAQHADPARPAARRVAPENRWVFASPEIRQHLHDAGREEEAQASLDAFWEGRDWTLYMDEENYLLEINALLLTGAIERAGTSMDAPPFAAVYRVVANQATVRGTAIPVDTLFSYNHKLGHVIIV